MLVAEVEVSQTRVTRAASVQRARPGLPLAMNATAAACTASASACGGFGPVGVEAAVRHPFRPGG